VKVLFFGSSDFSVPFIEAINNSGHRIVLVLTSADKAKGRGKIMSPNPVKLCAQKLHLDYLEDLDFGEHTMDRIPLTGFDCLVAVSFGRLIPKKILDIAGGRTINVHPSLLPKYRGPSPITTALLNGDTQTGISLIKIEEKFDTGDIYAQLKFDIAESDNRDALEKKIFKLGAPFLISLMDNYESMFLGAYPQSLQGVSYTKIFTNEDFKIDWSKSAGEIFNKIRAFSPAPGSVAMWKGKYLKILKAQIVELPQQNKDEIIYTRHGKGDINQAAQNKEEIIYSGQNKGEVIRFGQIINAEKTGLIVACGNSIVRPCVKAPLKALSLLMIKPQGKNEMHFIDFINGYRIKRGDSFEQ
jgi:methionyl-tRNA formyltransferase